MAARPAPRRISWLLVALAIVGGLGILVIGGSAFLVFRYVGMARVDAAEADRQFAETLSRLGNQPPRLSIDEANREIRMTATLPEGGVRPITGLHVLAWDADEQRLLHVEIPLWLVRMGSGRGARVTIDGGERISVDARTIERLGPGLLVDQRDGESRVVVWTE
jgi:hypothetical protein